MENMLQELEGEISRDFVELGGISENDWMGRAVGN